MKRRLFPLTLLLLLCACAGPEDVESTPAPPDYVTAEQAARAALDVSGFKPFDPPNEHNRTRYDTSGIRAAWETGDESDLGEKDAAILKRCREIFATVIPSGMTDFEKELALHGALLRSVRYDETSLDPATSQGQPDSGNPYGALVEWYGVDPTWNDPSAWEDLPEEMWDRTHHLHFNVTSDDLRRTNHQ